MRYLIALFVLLLTGCAYNVTLYPRGGGEQATGTFDGWSSMTVRLKGQTYSGSATRGTTTGGAIVGTTFVPMAANSNQYSAVLVGPGGAMRCAFVLNMEGGNGTCDAPNGITYDMVIK